MRRRTTITLAVLMLALVTATSVLVFDLVFGT